MVRSKIKFVLFFIGFSIHSTCAQYMQISSLEEFRSYHLAIVKVIDLAQRKTNYSNLLPHEGKFSYQKNFLDQWSSVFINEACAEDSEVCFFGGWPSKLEGNLCRTPWSFDMSDRFGISYDSDHYCGGADMFRCNPTLFGQGVGSNAHEFNSGGLTSGACVNFKEDGNSIQDVTMLCYEKTKGNIEDLYKKYLEDQEFRDRFHKMASEVIAFCSANSSYKACEYLLNTITTVVGLACTTQGQDLIMSTMGDTLGETEKQISIIENFLSLQLDTNSSQEDSRSRADDLAFALGDLNSMRSNVVDPTTSEEDVEVITSSAYAPDSSIRPEQRANRDDGSTEFAVDRSLIPRARPDGLVPDPEEVANDACNVAGTDTSWRRNCEKLFQSNIPQGALEYALETMRLNATGFRTNKCFDSQGIKPSNHPSMKGLSASEFENDLMGNGLPNKCQIIINDTDDMLNTDCRARMYYIDLCQGSEPVVEEDYFNMGTGTCRGGAYGFQNGRGLNTTVLGSFFTHNQTFDFQNTTSQTDAYRDVARQVENAGGPRQATAIQLLGLNNTNNLASSTGKYMHVSKWRSSWGCPSIAPENYYMIQNLARNGPSLVVNYARGKMEDLNECTE